MRVLPEVGSRVKKIITRASARAATQSTAGKLIEYDRGMPTFTVKRLFASVALIAAGRGAYLFAG